MSTAETPRPERGIVATPRPWLSWLVGVALLATVVLAALHFSEGREFVRLAERAKPWWFLLALVLQAATYLAQAEIWRRVGQSAGSPLPLRTAYELSLAKLFVDQALPSAGLSGNVMVAKAMERRDVPHGAVVAAVAVNSATYHAAYVVSLAVALVVAIVHGQANALIVTTAVVFACFAGALSVLTVAVAGGRGGPLGRWLEHMALGRRAVKWLREADPHLSRSPRLLGESTVLQIAIVLLDAATVWVLIRSLGAEASASGVFASFMISSLFRTVGIAPGGLGTFEATSVVTLRMAGVSLPVALSATLLFRGLSFWLPMLPGLWFSHRATSGGTPGRPRKGLEAYWALDPSTLIARLGARPEGLSSAEASERLRVYGPNELRAERPLSRTRVVLEQFRSPLVLLLLFAAVASALTGEWVDAVIVLVILLASAGIGSSREYSAQAAAAALRARVHTQASVVRDGQTVKVPVAEVVPGDVVLLSAGSLVPADAVILESTSLFVSEAALTGESFPVEKRPGLLPSTAQLAARSNCVFLGTNVRSGTARCLVAETGADTQFGAIARRLTLRPSETEFDRGIRHFGYLLTSAMTVMVLAVFAAHVYRGRPPIETLLFSVALAVGLSPELLPAILSVNLARGAQMMARRGVLVRRLNAIENLGSMDVLCTDKTGTLTEGVVEMDGAYDPGGARSAAVLEAAAVNAALATGLSNPLDEAVLHAHHPDLSGWRKLAEIPFDFVRKRSGVVVEGPGGARLLTKGAFSPVLEVCTRTSDGQALDPSRRATLESRFREWSERGVRVLAVAERTVDPAGPFTRDDERDLTFLGFLAFLDRPKPDAAAAVADLARLGVAVKVITGDNRLVAQSVAAMVSLRADHVLTGRQLDEMNDEALWRTAEETDLFAEVDPNQKERIILSLKKMGHVVGFMGDGVNDAPAMHAADTSLSVEKAVDVAREAADFVLLEPDLEVIRGGIEEGRRTFANTLKYVLTTTSANLGNMVSMAAASLFLPFLPLTAGQILLNNFLSDVPAFGIADDDVDPELVDRPRRWDMRFIGRFMVEFGLLSSAFDFLTFGVLLWVFRAGPELFRTGWFVESLLTELVIALVVRTRRPFFRSRPGRILAVSTAALVVLTVAIPYLPRMDLLGFVPLPAALLAALVAVTVLYVAATELMKRWFYRNAL